MSANRYCQKVDDGKVYTANVCVTEMQTYQILTMYTYCLYVYKMRLSTVQRQGKA